MTPEPAPGKFNIRKLAAITFIFACTSLAWIILGTTLLSRTGSRSDQLDGHVASTWGTSQEQSPPTATYEDSEVKSTTTIEDGRTIVHNTTLVQQYCFSLQSSRVHVNLNLDPRQKGLLWYSTYAIDFAGDYSFLNDTEKPREVTFHLKFPAQKALYDGLVVEVNGKSLAPSMEDGGISVRSTLTPNQASALHVAYHSQGLSSWRYKLADGVAQSHNFALTMHANFKDIDFADDTLSPTSKQRTADGWDLAWSYANLVSGFQIGMTMPEKLQPGPLAGDISYAAPVSLFFFFFLMMIITTLREIDLHPMNYFFLAGAFFAFHLLLAYLVDHVSIHIAMVISSLVSIGLVVSYLRLVVGIRFAALDAGIAQLIYLVVFSYAFFWKGFTGLAITIISVITLFVVMQVTGRIRWSEKFGRRPSLPSGNL
ncbi:MAG TPA: inner membrane CreD family protein [Candidatus Acidoferrum sp.]|nr:inner membrane CreD family protein [Candidatus Acidoferrum sp.]